MAQEPALKKPSLLWIAAGAGVLLLGLLVFFLSGSMGSASGSETGNDAVPAPVVEYARVSAADQLFMVTAPGRMDARQRLSVVGEVPGKISYIHPDFETGGRIPKNDVMLRIDPGDYRADLARAEAQLTTALASLERAQSDRDRQVELADIGAVPSAQKEAAIANFASAESDVAQAEAQVTIARRNLNKTTLRAPFDALVVSEAVAPDTYVAPGAPLAELIDASAGEISAGLSPDDVAAVRRARAAEENAITVRAVPNDASIGDVRLTGYLASFAPTIDPASRTVAVRAVFPEAFSSENQGSVFVGDFMTLEIEAKAETPVYRVPTAALRQEKSVWLIAADETLTRAMVTPLETRGTDTLVTSTVNLESQRVLTTPLAEETDGMTVRLQSELAQDNR